MNIKWQDHIESTPNNVLRGKPRIKGTRIPVSLILGYLAFGSTPEQVAVVNGSHGGGLRTPLLPVAAN